MSFDQLTKDSVSKKKLEVVITSNGKKLVFYANELTMTQRIRLAGLDKEGGDTFLQWVVFSITDQDGKSMTMEQAQSLPDEVLTKFFEAVMKVSETENKDKKKGRKKLKR